MCWSKLFEGWVINAIQWINVGNTYYTIHWTVIYKMDSPTHTLNHCGQSEQDGS